MREELTALIEGRLSRASAKDELVKLDMLRFFSVGHFAVSKVGLAPREDAAPRSPSIPIQHLARLPRITERPHYWSGTRDGRNAVRSYPIKKLRSRVDLIIIGAVGKVFKLDHQLLRERYTAT